MASDDHVTQVAPGEGAAAVKPGGFARLAGRVSRFALNLIVTAAVLLMLLMVGSQLTNYWRGATTPAPGNKPVAGASGSRNSDDTATIEVGNGALCVVQHNIVGDTSAALTALRSVCKSAAANIPTSEVLSGPLPAAEAALLARISSAMPAARLDDGGEIFELPGAIPMAVVTKIPSAPGVQAKDGHPPRAADARNSSSAAPEVAGPQRRVLIWGIALPAEKKRWVAYAFRPAAEPARGGPVAEANDSRTPIPKGAQKILSVRRSGEPALAAFTGQDAAAAERWRRFYDQWAADAGYSKQQNWKSVGAAWSIRFTRRLGDKTDTVDIQFGPDGHGGLRGMIAQDTETADGGKQR